MDRTKSLSGVFTDLPSRIRDAKIYVSDIERQRRILNPAKLVPVSGFFRLFAHPGDNASPFQRANSVHLQSAVINLISLYHKGAMSLVLVNGEQVPEDMRASLQYTNRLAGQEDVVRQHGMAIDLGPDMDLNIALLKGDGNVLHSIPFIQLGKALTVFDTLQRNDDFWWVTRKSALAGWGETDLQMWRDINEMEDFGRMLPTPDYKAFKGKSKRAQIKLGVTH